MHIGVWKEHADGERRVALTPDTAVKLVDKGHRVVVESGAGLDAGIEDDAFRSAGVDIGAPDAVRECEVSLAVRGAGTWEGEGSSPTDTLRSGALALAMFDPLWLPKNAQALAATGADVMSLELVAPSDQISCEKWGVPSQTQPTKSPTKTSQQQQQQQQ